MVGLASGVRLGIQKLGRAEEELDSPAEVSELEELTEPFWLPSSLDLPEEKLVTHDHAGMRE